MAESILKARLKEAERTDIRCSSAGIYAEEGAPMSANAKKAMKSMGIRARAGKAKLATPALLKKYNLVLTMTAAHKDALQKYKHKNVYTLAEFTHTADISDPYGGDAELYFETAKQIDKAIDILIETF